MDTRRKIEYNRIPFNGAPFHPVNPLVRGLRPTFTGQAVAPQGGD